METLATYIVDTLKATGINTVLDQSYLTNIAHGLVQYITITNILGISLGVLLIVSSIISVIKAIRLFQKDEGVFLVLLLLTAVLFVPGVVLITNCLIMLIKVTLVPDLAIVQYISQ